VEHDVALLSSISDRLLALDQGCVIATGDPSLVLEHPSVIASYLGTNPSTLMRSGPTG
jgi:branched-chain amino acid transport system ATP-binding protein